MANRKGLGVSKKYTIGSVHENGTGKFEILERFPCEDIPWLKFMWITGDKTGKIELNKELNIAASIHKFQRLRGKPTIWTPQAADATIEALEKQVKELTEKVNRLIKESAYCED